MSGDLSPLATGKGRHGLTLMEVVVVCAILGIVAAVVVPALAGLAHDPPEEAARGLVRAYRIARQAAATRGAPAMVVVELNTGAYTVVSQAARDGARDTVRQGALQVTPGLRLSGGRNGWAITAFDPFGRAGGEPVFVSNEGKLIRIATNPWTGAVDVRRH